MDKLVQYHNGNADITLYDDGTKIVETEDDEFDFDFASSMDICISERCDNGCEFCYANCTPNGKFGRFDYPFLDTIPAGVEIAINLQWPLPDGIEDFLTKMKEHGVIVNATVNQRQFEMYEPQIKRWVRAKKIYGLGISLTRPDLQFFDLVKQYPNAVIHTIAGVTPIKSYMKMFDRGFKVLVLGYKKKGRGADYYDEKVEAKIQRLADAMARIRYHFKVISFDNLALNQLHIKQLVTPEEWDRYYMGDESTSSFYVNLCNGTFSPSSLDELTLPVGDLTAQEMFQQIKGKSALKLEE